MAAGAAGLAGSKYDYGPGGRHVRAHKILLAEARQAFIQDVVVTDAAKQKIQH